METTNVCDKCGKGFDHYNSYYTDICDSCTEKVEGKSIAELQREAAKNDDKPGQVSA